MGRKRFQMAFGTNVTWTRLIVAVILTAVVVLTGISMVSASSVDLVTQAPPSAQALP